MSFTIICNNCKQETILEDLQSPTTISIRGQVEAYFDADVYIDCKCGNEITVDGHRKRE